MRAPESTKPDMHQILATRRAWLARAAAASAAAVCWPARGVAGAAVPPEALPPAVSVPGGVLRFAGVAEGRARIAAEDEWTAATSPFLRRAISGRTGEVPMSRFLAFLAGTVRPWTAESAAPWAQVLPVVARAVSAWRLPLPPEVLLVHTDGRDSAGAPYTRGDAVFLPPQAVRGGLPPADLLVHELFHVASRHDPAWTDRLCALVGFRPVAPLDWPPEWVPLRIANPDSPVLRHAAALPLPDGRTADLMPLLVAARAELGPGESFFRAMQLRLLEVEVAEGRPTVAARQDGRLRWHRPEAVPSYAQRLGGNTGYILHPEETLADNVTFLLMGRAVRNPALLERLAQAIGRR